MKSQIIGYGTDGDIGGYQGKYKQDTPTHMNYCECERGKQLKQHTEQAVRKQLRDFIESNNKYSRDSAYSEVPFYVIEERDYLECIAQLTTNPKADIASNQGS